MRLPFTRGQPLADTSIRFRARNYCVVEDEIDLDTLSRKQVLPHLLTREPAVGFVSGDVLQVRREGQADVYDQARTIASYLVRLP